VKAKKILMFLLTFVLLGCQDSTQSQRTTLERSPASIDSNQAKRERCFEQAKKSARELEVEAWKMFNCDKPAELMTDREASRCLYSKEFAKNSRKEEEERCVLLYP